MMMVTQTQKGGNMGIFRPTTETVNYYGVCNIGIVSIEDKSSLYGWADVYLNVVVKQEGSDYTRNLQLAGSFDKDANGDVVNCTLLRKIYSFFDGIGETAGINIRGEWEQEDGTPIENIEEYLNSKYGVADESQADMGLVAYVYKETPKQAGGTAYTRVYHIVYPDNPDNRKKLEDEIAWRKGKGYIKVFDESTAMAQAGDSDGDDMNDIPL
tara:strand:+ start:15 stop:650 length:636 start_codon:yes stop_codon:yes gene_type:complete